MPDWILLPIVSLPLAVLAAVLLLPTVSEAMSLLRLPFTRRRRAPAAPGQPRFVFLVLAHDEELLLGNCVRALLDQQYPAELRDVIVVADNCTDATAEVARAAGATDVFERFDTERRGKPHAIAWALDRIDIGRYDGVVIIDADTQVAPDFAVQLAARAPFRDVVLQPYIGVQNPFESAITRMASVHGTAAHGLAYRVKERVGLNVPLGVGMCIGAQVLQDEPWFAFSIAEDVELYAGFTARGVRTIPVKEARITAQEAKSLKQSSSQRHRWMSGKLEVLARYTPAILRSRKINFTQRFDAVAELLAQGPAVHLGAASVGALVAWLSGAPGGTWVAAALLASLVRPIVYTLLAIARDPHPPGALGAFAYLPIYTVWRLGPALKSLAGTRGSRWVRTDRHASETPAA